MSVKKELSIAHQIISILGMDDLTYTHVSCRSDFDHFFISPFGLLYEEVNEENLVNLSLDGEVSEDSDYKIFSPTGLLVHSAIYKTRSDINSVIHLHTNATIAVSVMKSGLLPLSQHALHFYDKVSYHDYDSMLLDEKTQAKKIADDLGKNNVMFLRNHGFITCGKTVQEALFYAYHLERASVIQTMVLQSWQNFFCSFRLAPVPGM